MRRIIALATVLGLVVSVLFAVASVTQANATTRTATRNADE